MRISKLILLLVAVAFTTASYAQKKDDIAVKMNKAGEALNAKKYAESAKLFDEALKMIKTSTDEGVDVLQPMAAKLLADSHRLNAMLMAQAKNYEPAIAEFKVAHAQYKKNQDIKLQRKTEELLSGCFQQMANNQLKANKYDEAIAICKKGLEVNKTDTKLMLLIALCHEKASRDAEVIKAYELVMATAKTAPRLKPDGDKAMASLVNSQLVVANKLADKGQVAPAMVKINTALKYNPKSAEAEYLRISIYNKAKDYASVVKFGPAAINLQPSAERKSDLNFMIGASYVALENNAKALEHYKKVTAGKYIGQAKGQVDAINKAATPEK